MIIALSGSLCAGRHCSAKTIAFPDEDDALFKFAVPDKWEPETDDDDVLEANSPNDAIHLSAWEFESRDDAKEMTKRITDALRDHAKKIAIDEKPTAIRPNGMNGMMYEGRAEDKEDGHEIDVVAVLITTETRAAVVMLEADAAKAKQEVGNLNAILRSITPPTASTGDKRLLRAAVALDDQTKPATTFTTDAAQIYAFYIGEALHEGDKLKGELIAEDVGSAAPQNTKILDTTITVKSLNEHGAFRFGKPDKGWPPGSYRVEISVNDKLAETLKFTVSSE